MCCFMHALLQKLKLFMQRSSVSITAPLICQQIKVWRSVLQLDRLSWLKMSDSLIVDDAIMKTDD